MKRTLTFVALLLACLPGWSADTSGTAGFNFLTLPVGARPTALGQAFVSVPGEVQALAYNPASIATLDRHAFSFQHLSYVEGVTQEGLMMGRAPDESGQSWGLSANYLRVGGIDRTVATLSDTGDGYLQQGSFSTYDMMLGGTYAKQFGDHLFVGTTLKFLQESLGDASSSGAALDAGFLYMGHGNRVWNIGGSVQHLGYAKKFVSETVKLPTTLRLGFSAQPFAQWLFTTDYVKRQDTSGEFNVGAEVTPKSFLSFRLGYRSQVTAPDLGGLSQFSAGLGLRMGRCAFDYAFIPLGDLGVTHRISLNFYVNPAAR